VAKQKQPFNPFYAALIVVGVAFTITACAYALMMVRATQPMSSDSADLASLVGETGLMKLLDERGMEILGVEVLLLALATVGAIGLDQYRSGRERIIASGTLSTDRELSPRRGQTRVAGSEAPGSRSEQVADPEGVKPSSSTPSGSMQNAGHKPAALPPAT
jgi:hypothetical protein